MLTMLEICCLLIMASLVSSCVSVSGQSSGMREVQNKSQADRPAPAECIAAFRQLFAYVKKNEPDIVTDEKAQNRWLTKRMRQAFVEHIKRSGNPKENPDYPSNSVFVGVWNRPTTYSIVGSRHYDFRNKENPNDNRAVIDVLYEWETYSDGLDNQYPGEKQFYSFIFVYEGGAWRLDDIYTYDDVYTGAQSLRNYIE